MALKITCPHCSAPRKLEQPYPLPGAELHCLQCGQTLAISYPPGMVDRLQARGVVFAALQREPDVAHPPPARPPPAAPAPAAAPPAPPPAGRPTAPTEPRTSPVARPGDTLPPFAAPGAPPRGPHAASPPRAPPPAPAPPPARAPEPTAPMPPRAQPPAAAPAVRARSVAPPTSAHAPARTAPAPPPARRRSVFWRLIAAVFALGLTGAIAAVGLVAWAFWHYGQQLPTVEALGRYEPPTVTVVYDAKGRRMGEIYEKRRYVTPLADIPKHLQDAFIAAEDNNFWTHGGVDYEGIVRAVGRNLSRGRKAQGASTITMQVTRNFLLTRDKTYERKIKEILLSWRLEETFSKEHILYLYLNEIYLGSGAYGVEAATRTYFGKHVQDITLAEAAILAGLPQRPSDYSPHRHWDKARARQEYVLDQMLNKGYIDQQTHSEALRAPVDITVEENEFLTAAPYFTEHIRRYLVETYGFDKIYNDGLSVETTCDLDLQKTAQDSLIKGVVWADEQVGWRGPAEKIPAGQISDRLAQQEQALREEASRAVLRVGPAGVGGYGAPPGASTLTVGRRYPAIVLEVEAKHAIVGIGRHRALVPTSWTTWAVEPNPERSYKGRSLRDLREALAVGDLVQVDVEGLDAASFDNLKGYAPARGLAAAKLRQPPELQGALFAYRLSDGAVLSMVGGTDFQGSEYNRATQARRQVGSTFKPIVYAAAVATRKITAGTLVQDAPLVFQTIGDKLWKPGNYGEDYLGNITLRRALQLSKNVCTVRVLDQIGLDPVYELAGPKLRIGYEQPLCKRTHEPAGTACDGEVSASPVSGMQWCQSCDPTSCPLVLADSQTVVKDGQTFPVGDSKACLDEPQVIDGQRWCHSCDVNLRVCDWLPLERIPDTDPCVDARRDDAGQTWCRTCDLSMGLGSSSLTMVELARAYSAFATYGKLVEPHYINKVIDRDGTVIEAWEPPRSGWPQVLEPGVAGVAHYLLREVATGGTAAKSNSLGVQVAGKTGTTNDFFDAWFVGYDPEVIAAAWVGYDQPRSIGQSFTGGAAALPIWMDYMKAASPKGAGRTFGPIPGVEMVPIDEKTGRVATGGRPIPMLPGTAPTNVVGEVGQLSTEELLTTDF